MQSNGFVNVLTAFSLDFLTSMICPFMSLISTSRLFLATSCDDKSVPCGSLPKALNLIGVSVRSGFIAFICMPSSQSAWTRFTIAAFDAL